MVCRVPVIDTRPARGRPQSDLIAGNEFLKLFLERHEVQRDLHSGDYEGRGEEADGGVKSNAASRSSSARSLEYKAKNGNANSNQDDGKQVVKLVTSGSKIVFLEEYDDDDAVIDAVARDIDLQKEKVPTTTMRNLMPQQQVQKRKSTPSDEVKVISVSVSSSSKRGGLSHTHPAIVSNAQVSNFPVAHASMHADRRHQHQRAQVQDRTTSSKSPPVRAVTVTSTLPTTTSVAATGDFINRSHKSEFSIEEAEPLTTLQHPHKPRNLFSPSASSADSPDDGLDSQNSASTNIHNVLAAPLVQADMAHSSSSATSAYHSSRNSTSVNQAAAHINQTPSSVHAHEHAFDTHSSVAAGAVGMPNTSTRSTGVEEKLLPFQTVIYHDTKEGHGPQSRSISYSSISQNVEDLHAWQQTAGILAEAQFNVSESLKPITRPQAQAQTPTQTHTSEPAKFYSVPAKMYGVPSKFYSEPAKVYSEPAKVYGQPEKFYSEPAKVYSQPAKFYSEPAKVYSQPAKVYSEPAKNYWPNPSAASAATTTTTTTTTTPAPKPSSSRRPAIVSRIAFGEAQTSTAVPTNFVPHSSASRTTTFQQHQHQYQHQQQHHRPHTYQHSHANQPTQPRRVLFNLDKLPYDLLNAPEQSSQPLLEPDLSKSVPPLASATFALAQQRPCLESTFSSPALPLSISQQHQQQLQQQRQQHSSLSSNQHSNQNAKGLPNRDLVKCVSQFAHSPAPSAGSTAHFTTESSRHSEDLYTPTPEQNYEIEESVSVMTNGRAHGVQGIGSITTTTTTTTASVARQPARSRIRYGGNGAGLRGVAAGTSPYSSNANANVAGAMNDDGDGDGDGSDDQNSNNNNNNNRHNHNYNHNYDDEEDVVAAGHKSVADDAVGNDGDIGEDGDDDNDDDDDDDDSKVAYVVEGRNYRKYRVEEKTDDGFIVGEYGVVDHNDGNLRGVRYTADSTINRSLIQKALLTFLKLK